MNTELIETIKQRILTGGQITPEEALQLAETPDKETLYAAADHIRASLKNVIESLANVSVPQPR